MEYDAFVGRAFLNWYQRSSSSREGLEKAMFQIRDEPRRLPGKYSAE